jgi:hypothetical protein
VAVAVAAREAAMKKEKIFMIEDGLRIKGRG